MIKHGIGGLFILLLLAGCSSMPEHSGEAGGKYYQNDGPQAAQPHELSKPPVPKVEPFKASTLRPYTVLGKTYTPLQGDVAYSEEGIASWYGRQFHGQKTATGEIYNMHAYTAAHPTLPLPSYAKVTNLQNGKSVIVRVNDRGPFLHHRLIDLSYEAARALEYANRGTAHVRVERLTFAQIRAMSAPKVTAPKALPNAPTPQATPLTLDRGQTTRQGDATTPQESPALRPQEETHAPLQLATQPVPKLPKLPYRLQFGFFSSSEGAASYLAHLEAVSSNLGSPLKLYQEATNKGYRVLSEHTYTLDNARLQCQQLQTTLNVNCFPLKGQN